MKDDLPFLDGALVEHLGRNVLGRQVDSLPLRLLEDRREEPHLEFERQDVDPRGAALAALGDDLLHEQTPDRQIDRTHDHQPAGILTVEEGLPFQRLRLVGAEDQFPELALLLREGLLLLLAGQSPPDVEIRLTLVATEIQDLERAEGLVGGLQLTLHADEALAGRVNAELAEIRGNPLAAELFGRRRQWCRSRRRNRLQDRSACWRFE